MKPSWTIISCIQWTYRSLWFPGPYHRSFSDFPAFDCAYVWKFDRDALHASCSLWSSGAAKSTFLATMVKKTYPNYKEGQNGPIIKNIFHVICLSLSKTTINLSISNWNLGNTQKSKNQYRNWKLWKIIRLNPGKDGVLRVADIGTANGVIQRAFTECVHFLYRPVTKERGAPENRSTIIYDKFIESGVFQGTGHVMGMTCYESRHLSMNWTNQNIGVK